MKESGKSKLHAKVIQMKDHLPISLAVGLFVVSISLWIFLSFEEEKHDKNLMALEVNTVKTLLTYDLNQSILSLERLKLRWEDKLYSEKKQWLSDTRRIVANKEELLAIEWVDKDYIVRWIEPLEGNEAVQNLDLSFEKRRKKTLDLAKNSGETAITGLINFVQGGKGFLSVSPILIDGEFDGFILGVFEINKVLSSFVKELASKGVTIQFINLNDQPVKEEPFFDKKSSQWNIRTVLNFKHLHLGTIFSFNDSFFPSKKPNHPNIIGVSGILLSVIFSMLVYFNKKSKFQSSILIKEIAAKDEIANRLERSENKFRTYFELTLIGMAITSLEKGWLEVNDKLCEIFGYPRDELVKLKWVDIAYPDDVKQERINFNQVLMGEIDGYSMDTRFIRKDGKIIYASVSVRAVRNPGGGIDYFLTLVQDISERKITEIKLQESEKRIHLITDSLPPLISYIGQDHHFKFNSKRYEDWFKISRNEITGKHVKELLGQKGYDLIKNYLEKALSGQRVVYETLMPYKYGQSRYVRGEFIPDIRPDKEVEGIFVLINDITNQKQNEEELKTYRNHLEKLVKERTSELENTHKQLIHAEKLSATGKLAATMSHEINNPICGIRNALEGIYERADLKYKEMVTVRMAIGECNRIANLVKDLNDFNRPSPATPELMDINSVISNLLLLENKKLNKKHIALELNYASDLPKVAIITDQFKQVILNLLNNAEDSLVENREDGRIAIATESKDSKVMIHISDNGYGISEDILAHIFEPFVTTKSAVKGVGLGLSISYGIMKAHGGDILAESTFGNGTTFSIILPVNEKS